ncbi:EamA family transporter [Bacillus mangrovi]|uniref:EamA family transporter n=1 Tax=Metabacillus mangrovi TaxID=1491830 RepID=A0A7X2S7V3_9BACI|nr:DMT family transporter [Metabacillus mangrovi]MTH54426.1 EamA family transporter [Metabacillus mangrovi]
MNKGILLALLSSLVFSIMNALVKLVSADIPSSEIVFFRSVIGTALIYLLMRKKKVSFSKSGVPMLALRGVLGAFYLLAYFYTISKLPLTEASILAHLSPFFAILCASFFLKERLPKVIWIVLPAAFAGALLVMKPFDPSAYSIYALAGILSAVFAAGAATSIRYLSKKHHAYEIVFYFLATGTVVSIPLMWGQFVVPTLADWFILVCIGAVSLAGQIFLTGAFTHENVVVVEVTRYIGIVFNAMWGLIFWLEVPDSFTVLGGALIVLSCILLSRKKNSRLKAEKEQVKVV